MKHEQFQGLLDEIAGSSGVGQEVLGEVLARISLKAPEETSRVEIAVGNPAARRRIDQRELPQGTVSKAVKALKDRGLIEDGEKLLWSADGRTLAPLRLGSLHAIIGVKVTQTDELPRQVTTALFGLDGARVLGATRGTVHRWDQVPEIIRQHAASLKTACDRERAARGLAPLQIFGVGIEVSSPVYNGEVMPHLTGDFRPGVQLETAVHRLFATGAGFPQPVPVIVENDANALAVLAINQVHYAEPDLAVVAVFDEGIGGGLVMDGRLRRGGNGRAMEIGHLTVGYPPGQEEPQGSPPGPAGPGFSAPCTCGHFGHVDTLATPRRIRGMLGGGRLDQLGRTGPGDPRFREAWEIFTCAGAALGRALAHVSNTVNPSKIIAYLPTPLAEPQPGTAAAAYLNAVRQEVTPAFAAGTQDDYLTVRPLPPEPEDTALLGARAAAVCVLESFIEHALRLDGCTTTLRRTSSSTGEFRTLSPQKLITSRSPDLLLLSPDFF